MRLFMRRSNRNLRDANLSALRKELNKASYAFMNGLARLGEGTETPEALEVKAAAYADAVRHYRWALLAHSLYRL